jgi:hypothetical protein
MLGSIPPKSACAPVRAIVTCAHEHREPPHARSFHTSTRSSSATARTATATAAALTLHQRTRHDHLRRELDLLTTMMTTTLTSPRCNEPEGTLNSLDVLPASTASTNACTHARTSTFESSPNVRVYLQLFNISGAVFTKIDNVH